MHRYKEELASSIPSEEVDVIWGVFDVKDSAMQQGMIDRYKRSSILNSGLIAEVDARRN
jgi:hypothetical protein